MEWVNSAGGVLICAEPDIGANWMGISGLSAGSKGSDYERANATEEYIELMPCGQGAVLVLGDEPLQSAFFRLQEGALAIARWVALSPGQDAEKVLCHGSDIVDLADPVGFRAHGTKLSLFDSALRPDMSTCVQSDIRPGHYEVTSEALKMDGCICFIIHRFLASRSEG
jgi:hypothetical protein